MRHPEKRKFVLDAAGLTPVNAESLEKQCFTGLHRIVLGLGGAVDLNAYLKINSSDIDKQDLTGKTALAWPPRERTLARCAPS